MENGCNIVSSSSTSRNYQMPSFSDCLPPVSDYIHSFKAADSISRQCSEIIDHFSMEIAQAMAPKNVVKDVEDLSHQICKYHSLALTIGTNIDGALLRQELLERQQKACDTVVSTTTQLSNAFRSCGLTWQLEDFLNLYADVLYFSRFLIFTFILPLSRRADSMPKKEMGDLERSCKVLVACVHNLDRELRRTMNLYHLFPLVPHADAVKTSHFIQTGYADKVEVKEKSSLPTFKTSTTELYFKERDSWRELENEILRVHDLDVELHRDEILGPILDYLTLCPMGEIPGSKVSLDDASDLPDGYCDQETLFRKRSNLVCYLAAILAVACVGGGVLMAVIFLMLHSS